MQTSPSLVSRRIYGIFGVLLVVTLVATAIGAYRKAFTPAVNVILHASRSGLLMDPGAEVRVRDVRVGEVRTVEIDPQGEAVLRLALDPGEAARIPSNAIAQLLPKTTFGAKYVNLSAPGKGVAAPITSGASLRTSEVTPEINEVFSGLQSLLTTVEPSKLNATLGAVAQALNGRGSRSGEYLTKLNAYLQAVNPHLGQVDTDLHSSADVVNTYADVSPQFLTMLHNSSLTSRTLTETEATLHAVLLGFTTVSQNGEDFLGEVQGPLLSAVDNLRPVTGLLAKYSPSLTCSVQGLNESRKRNEKIIGTNVPGVQALGSFLPAQEPYRYPRDLPKVGLENGPHCYGLPYIGETVPPRQRFDDGTHVYDNPDDRLSVTNPVTLYTQLFGLPQPAAGVPR